MYNFLFNFSYFPPREVRIKSLPAFITRWDEAFPLGVYTPGKVHTMAPWTESHRADLGMVERHKCGEPGRPVFQIDKRRTPSSFHSTPFPGLPVTVAYPSVTVKGSVRIGAIQSDHSSQSADSLTRSSCAETNA